MPYTHSDYAHRSQRLAAAAQQLLDSLDDAGIDRTLAISEVEHAAADAPASDLARGFEPSEGKARTSAVSERPEDALSAALLELQSANVLVSAGVALNEHGGGANRRFLSETVQQLEASAEPVDFASRAFEPASNVRSTDLDGARRTFRDNADGVLGDIIDEAVAVIGDILTQIKKLDAARVLEAVRGLGAAIPLVASGGRLIKRGLEKLKNVLDALRQLIGPELFGKLKDKVLEVWNKAQAGDYTRQALAVLVQQENVEGRIATAAAREAALDRFDAASNEVASLADEYARTMKLLRSLLNAVITAGAVLALLHVALPWLPAAVAATYATLVALVVATAIGYTGSVDWLRRDRSIGEVADRLG